ncbi:hypothetical protein N0V82_001182 [Gnomoniopsis sp. IMI 355080]|nr:hypothetical protein N0V82_001182 [Gnomoniopsis sp. IMI 355080]
MWALDKSMLGYAAVFDLKADTHLQGFQYSLIDLMSSIAQLAWQPISMMLILKVPARILLPCMVLGWGIVQASASAATSFGGLMAYRFLLGLFEAGCLPLLCILTGAWYRKAEQSVRIAAWYGTNGLATIAGAALSYGLGKVESPMLVPWRIMFLSTGLLTIVSVPFVYWKLDNEPSTARFLTKNEQQMAVERLRANQAGTDSNGIQWRQAFEALIDIKTYLFLALSLGISLGARVTSTLGPLILNGLGYDQHTALLFNMPFGALQYILGLFMASIAVKFRWQSLTLGMSLFPAIIGLVVLFIVPHRPDNNVFLLVGYHLLAFMLSFNSLTIFWILANTAGQTKKAAMMSLYNAAASVGNIIGPILFRDNDAPKYDFGLKATLGAYIVVFWLVIILLANLVMLNRMQEAQRVARGKPAKLHDHSMDGKYTEMCVVNGYIVGNFAFADLTDRQNDEFIHVY